MLPSLKKKPQWFLNNLWLFVIYLTAFGSTVDPRAMQGLGLSTSTAHLSVKNLHMSFGSLKCELVAIVHQKPHR